MQTRKAPARTDPQRCGLFLHSENKPFKVIRFGNGEKDRVIACLRELPHEVHVGRPVRRNPHDIPESGPPHIVGTRESEQMAIGGESSKGLLVEVYISPLALLQLLLRLDE